MLMDGCVYVTGSPAQVFAHRCIAIALIVPRLIVIGFILRGAIMTFENVAFVFTLAHLEKKSCSCAE